MDSLTCQQCHQPLLLDPSIQQLTPTQYSLIASSLPTSTPSSSLSPVAKLGSLPPTARAGAEIWSKHHHAAGSGPGVAESFIMLGESALRPSYGAAYDPSGSSHDGAGPSTTRPRPGLSSTELAQNLHSLISSKTPISHPICVECVSLLQTELQKELDELQKERDAYIAFEQGVQRNRATKQTSNRRVDDPGGKGKGRAGPAVASPNEGLLGEHDTEGTHAEWDELVRRKQELIEEEERLVEELKRKEAELAGVRVQEEEVRREELEVERQEEQFLLEHHALSAQMQRLQQTLSSAETHLLLSTSLLQHLESTNVYNDAFQIGYVPLPSRTDTPGQSHLGGSSGSGGAGYVGTINGLRLGGRPAVEWDEINAAWGLVALCVDRMAARVGFTFSKYKIFPLGSYSRIDELPPSRQTYELHASPDLSGLLHNRRFSTGLICLLDCIRQLVEFGQSGSRGWPIGSLEIRKDRISGYSIRLPGLASGRGMGLPSMSIMGLGGSASASQVHSHGSSAAGQEGDASRREGRGGASGGAELSPEEHWTKACMAVLKVLKQILIAESEAERVTVSAAAPVQGLPA